VSLKFGTKKNELILQFKLEMYQNVF